MSIKTTRFDAAKYLEAAEDQTSLLDEALATGDAKVIVHAIGTIARARGMSDLARATGIGRTTLYAALADDANPTIETVMKVLDGLNVELRARPQAVESVSAPIVNAPPGANDNLPIYPDAWRFA